MHAVRVTEGWGGGGIYIRDATKRVTDRSQTVHQIYALGIECISEQPRKLPISIIIQNTTALYSIRWLGSIWFVDVGAWPKAVKPAWRSRDEAEMKQNQANTDIYSIEPTVHMNFLAY
jgi:hypothetical protein